eukprot:scaffold88791_cov65-Phaeocystis_antarctica.AAC.4
MAPQRISVARGRASLFVDASVLCDVRICLSIAQRLLVGPPGPAAAASQLGSCASKRVFQREPDVGSVREPFRPSVHPVVGEIYEELFARLRCRGYHKRRLRVERGWIACRIAQVHPLRIVEARAGRSKHHERVRVPIGEVRRYAIEGAVSMAEDSHAFEDGAVRADDACARERVAEERHVQAGEAIRLHAVHKAKSSIRCFRRGHARVAVQVALSL